MTNPEDEIDMTAAELALGVLDGEERAIALRRVLAEPGFARDVDTWRGRFAVLFAEWPEKEAPPGLEQRIGRSIDAAPRSATGGWRAIAALMTAIAAALLLTLLVRPTPSTIYVPAPAPLPAPAPSPTPPPSPTPSPAAKLTPPPLAAPASALAPAPVPARVREPAFAPTQAPLVAALAYDKKVAPVAAIYDPNRNEIRVAAAPPVQKNRSAQLWAIGADGVPHALGLLATAAPTRIVLTAIDRERLATGTTLAVSIEPVGGSPTGLPTGPVVATGPLAEI